MCLPIPYRTFIKYALYRLTGVIDTLLSISMYDIIKKRVQQYLEIDSNNYPVLCFIMKVAIAKTH